MKAKILDACFSFSTLKRFPYITVESTIFIIKNIRAIWVLFSKGVEQSQSLLEIIGASLAFKHKVVSTILLTLIAVFLIFVGSYTIHKNIIVFGGLFFLPAIFAGISKK